MHDLPEKELLETIQQLRRVVELLDSQALSLAIRGKDAAARAIATEANTEPFLLDMWGEQQSPENVKSSVKKTLERGEKILTDKKMVDDREKILSGEEFGVVFIPTELLRQLWGLGEAVVHFQDKQAEAGRVEPRAIQVMELAAKWVRDARVRWGTPDRVEKINVGPLLRIDQRAEPPF